MASATGKQVSMFAGFAWTFLTKTPPCHALDLRVPHLKHERSVVPSWEVRRRVLTVVHPERVLPWRQHR